MPSGEPNLSPSIVEPCSGTVGSPHRAKISHSKSGSVQSSSYFQVMMCPYTLSARGLIASMGGRAEPAVVLPSGLLTETGSVPRRLLVVRVAIAVSACGKVSIHSGRSIIVAPTASAAARVLIKMSFNDQFGWSGVGGTLPGTSGSQSPVPSALNLATYRIPSLRGLIPFE